MKKNNKKAFTLIELLAVITILAIILTITAFAVAGIINDTKTNSAKISVKSYISAVNTNIINSKLNSANIDDGAYKILENGNLCIGTYSDSNCDGEVLNVDVKKGVPSSGVVVISDKRVTSVINANINGETISYDALKDEELAFSTPTIVDFNVVRYTNSLKLEYTITNAKTFECVYGTTNSYGKKGVISDNKNECIINNLAPNQTYYYKLIAKNSSDEVVREGVATTLPSASPMITVAPNGYGYIKTAMITYANVNLTDPNNYIYTTSSATSNANVVECGTGTEPGECSATPTMNLKANIWYKTGGSTINLTYNMNGMLIATTYEGDKLVGSAQAIITSIDSNKPVIEVNNAVYGEPVNISIYDNQSGVKYFAVTETNEAPNETLPNEVNTGSVVNKWYTTEVTTEKKTVTFTGLDAKTYYAWGKDELGNYSSVEFIVRKSKAAVSADSKTAEYTGGNIPVDDLTPEAYPGTTYTYYNGTDCTGNPISTPQNAGTYSLKITIPEADNYYGETKCIVFTIEKATPQITKNINSVTTVKDKNVTLTLKSNVAGTFGIVSNDTGVVTVSTASISASANQTYTVTLRTIADGETNVQVNFTPTNTNNYKTVSSLIGVKVIDSALVPTTANNCKSNLKYTGTTQTLTNNFEGIIYTNNTGKNAGTYTITASLDPSTGLVWSDETTGNKTFTCEIAKADDVITITETSATYNKTSKSASVNVQSGLTPTITYYSNSSCTNTKSPVDAGTYYVIVSTAGNTNYKAKTTSCTKAITINKATLTPSATCSNKVYDGSTSATCNISLATILSGDDVTASKVCTFANATVQSNKTVTCGDITLDGSSKDNYSLSSSTATATATITKQQVNAPTNLNISTAGIVTWTNSSNATGYQISIDGTNYTNATNGINYFDTITAEAGERIVYVRAINSDSTNYNSPSTAVSKKVNVYTLTVRSNNTNYGVVVPSSFNFISGATYTTSSNILEVKSGSTLLTTITATPVSADGYDTNITWSSESGTLNGNATITATFTRVGKSYTVNFYQGKAEETPGVDKIGEQTCTFGTACTLKAYSGTNSLNGVFPYSSAAHSADDSIPNYHWTFYGWSNSLTGTARAYTNSAQLNPSTYSSTVNLYALGSKNYYFNTGKAPTASIATQQIWNPYSTSNDYLTEISVPSQVDITGWTFCGYKAASDVANAANCNSPALTSSEAGTSLKLPYNKNFTTYRSMYKRTLTVNYDSNGGTGTTNKTELLQYYNSGHASGGANTTSAITSNSITLASNSFVKTGYDFSQWADGSTSGTKYNAGAAYTGIGDTVDNATVSTTMHAIWTPGIFEIALDNQSATTAGTAKIYEKYNTGYYLGYTSGAVSNYMTSGQNPITVPQKNGYTFVGYYTGQNGSGVQYIDVNGKLTSSASTTQFSASGSLYAKWTDTTKPDIFMTHTGSAISGTITDAGSGVVAYAITNSNETPADNSSDWITITNSPVASFDIPSTNHTSGARYIHAKDAAGNTKVRYTSVASIGMKANDTYTQNYTSSVNNMTCESSNTNLATCALSQDGTTYTVTITSKSSEGSPKIKVKYSDGSVYRVYNVSIDVTAPTPTITGGTTLKTATQPVTLKCSDNAEVTAYYFGKTNPTSIDSITTTTSLSSLTGNGLSQNITASGTYYLACRDATGNFEKTNIVIRKYEAQNVLLTTSGTAGTYTSDNYVTSGSTSTYYVKDGTSLTLASVYTTTDATGSFLGYTTAAPSATAQTPSKTEPTVSNNTTKYYMWFNRTTFTVTLNAGANGSLKGDRVDLAGTATASAGGSNTIIVRYGEKIKATATPQTGYSFNGFSGGYLSGTTNPQTGAAITEDKTITASWKDTNPPSLTLSKQGTVNGFNGWKLTSTASLDLTNQIVSLNSTGGAAMSPYYQVDEQNYGWSYDFQSSSAATNRPNGGDYTGTRYFDSKFNAYTGANGYAANGQSTNAPALNTWKSVGPTNYNQGTGIEYFNIDVKLSAAYSTPVTKYRNFKVYGDIYAKDKYTISLTASDAEGSIATKKYASGSQSVDYFANSGTSISGNSFDVTANGTYTVYVADNAGNGTVKTISVDKIDKTAPTISSFVGKMLNTDPTFASGTNNASIYNNSGGGTVTVNRVANSEWPDGSGYVLEVKTTGTASPGIGGYVQYTNSYANGEFYHVIVAKVPVGYSIEHAQNATGDGREITWLTSTAGTGKFETYIYKHKCGSSGTFSNFGHVYLIGNAATSSNPVTWYVAYSSMFDVTNTDPTTNYIVSYANDATSGIVSYAYTTSNSQPTSWKLTQTSKYAVNVYPITSNSTYYAWFMDAAGNISSKSISTSIKPVKIYYHPNGGTVGSSSYTTCNNGWVCTNSTTYFVQTKDFGSSGDLYNTTTFGISRTGYSIPDGTEWCTQMDGGGTCFDHDVSYTYATYKNAAQKNLTDNYELDLYTHWSINSNTLTVNPNGGSVTFNGAARTSTTSKAQNYNTTIALPNASRGNSTSTVSSYQVSYNSHGGSSSPSAQTATKTATTTYTFSSWSSSGDCGTLSNGTYTYPSTNGTTCTKTASWTSSTSNSGGSITLPSPGTQAGYTFAGWYTAASGGTRVGGSGDSYTPSAAITLHAQWTALELTMSAPTPTGTTATGTGTTKTAGFKVGATVTFTCSGQSGNYPSSLQISGQTAVSNSSNASSISATYTINNPSTSFTISATCTGAKGNTKTVTSVAKPIYRQFQLLYEKNGASAIGSTSSSVQTLAANSTSGDGGTTFTLPSSITCVNNGRSCGSLGWDLTTTTTCPRFAKSAKVNVCTSGTSGCSGTGSKSSAVPGSCSSAGSSGTIELGASYTARYVYAVTYSQLNNPTKLASAISSSGTITKNDGNVYMYNSSNSTSTSFTMTNRCINRSDGKKTFAFHAGGGAYNAGTICSASQSSCSKAASTDIFKSNYSFGCMSGTDGSTFIQL